MLNNTNDNPQNSANDLSHQEDDEIDLADLLGTLLDNKWLIITATAVVLFIGMAKAFIDPPIYKTDAMLQIQEQSKSSLLEGLGEMTDLMESKKPILAEIELIKSRMILGETAANLKLNTLAHPKYFPLIGAAMARRFKSSATQEFAAPLFGQDQYAWGGEDIHVDNFSVPANWQGKTMTLVADKHGYFQLLKGEALVLEGQVNKLTQKKIPDEKEPVTLFVSMLKARPGTQFELVRQSDIRAIDALKSVITVTEKGKASGILELTTESSSPELAVRTLNEIANIYVQQNVDDKSAEAQKTLDFLQQQIPKLKEQLEISTAALNDFRTSKGSLDLEQETQGVLQGVVELQTQTTLLQQKRDELRQRFTITHPSVLALDKQIARLQEQMIGHEKKIETLPETQKVILRLSRDVQVNTELYTALLNNAQTIKVAKAGTVGDVRIIDYAVLPTTPIKPKKALIIAIAFILGLILGIAIALIRKSMQRGVEDPDLIEKQLHIPVYATVPFSEAQKNMRKQFKTKDASQSYRPILLAVDSPEDLAIESLRSLRTSLHFAFLEAQNNTIMITGPSPSVGKSFIALNLSIVLANAGKKILLIDGDLRRGYLHKELGVRRENGLSELVSQTITLPEIIHKIPSANIDFIATGATPPNPSEILLHNRFAALLETIRKQYDYVIIDAPPILAVTDAAIIGRLVGATLMVVRAGVHPMREIEQANKRLIQGGVRTKGIVFNGIVKTSSAYGAYRYTYQYDYKSRKH
ncbi:putative tyrosine-protein kinase EpsB [Crenothrix polyspora]|uniref:Putative tyrosine-protein kinase EpsB n=1 Tax=Crenothrix polyspora TaxID=360316 RepID=A0A1R4HEG2_9GAMM|nr:polysaccharide biosynthesis tyrosine autokinase [Crenothrix polyspora]SJM94596.1 putative tyrosine-protein kinase EpsB [Crenothrix polyspora]